MRLYRVHHANTPDPHMYVYVVSIRARHSYFIELGGLIWREYMKYPWG